MAVLTDVPQRVHAGVLGHSKIEQHNVRLVFPYESDRFLAVRGFGNDLHTFLLDFFSSANSASTFRRARCEIANSGVSVRALARCRASSQVWTAIIRYLPRVQRLFWEHSRQRFGVEK